MQQLIIRLFAFFYFTSKPFAAKGFRTNCLSFSNNGVGACAQFIFFGSMKQVSERRFLFVINPVAGTRKKDSLEAYIRTRAAELNMVYDILHSKPNSNAASIRQAAQAWNATDLIACGGDGTVNMVAAAVSGTELRLGIIPVGSGNGLARTANIPLKPSEALDTIVNGSVISIDCFTVNGRFACLLAGLGLDAAVAAQFANSSKRGLATYTTQTLIEFFKAHPYQFEVNMDGISFFTDAFFISVANSNQFGNNVTIAPEASICDGLLDVIIVQKMPKWGLPFAVLQQIRGNNRLQRFVQSVSKNHVLYYQTKELTITNHKMAPLHIDGDPADTSQTVEFAIHPAVVQLLVP